MWTSVPDDLAACLPGGPVWGLVYLMTWPPVCQEGHVVPHALGVQDGVTIGLRTKICSISMNVFSTMLRLSYTPESSIEKINKILFSNCIFAILPL